MVKASSLPHKITSLSKISGEVLITLFLLRGLCGSWRYTYRLAQRITPVLIRQPNAPIWCIKHKIDMVLILASTTSLIDEAQEILSYKWNEIGTQFRNDDRRAEPLNAAARELRNLSTN